MVRQDLVFLCMTRLHGKATLSIKVVLAPFLAALDGLALRALLR